MRDHKKQSQLTGSTAATCPFMRTLMTHDPDIYNAKTQTMSRAQLKQFVEKQRPAGVQGDLERVLTFFARVNQTPLRMKLGNWLMSTDNFSIHFPGSRGDHPGSSGIYRVSNGQFDPSAFQSVTKHSSDGKTMTPINVANAIIEFNAANQGSRSDLFKSAGEFALLFMLLRQPNATASPTMQMNVGDMQALFEHNQWPPHSLANLATATTIQWLEVTKLISAEILKTLPLHTHFRRFLSKIRKSILP